MRATPLAVRVGILYLPIVAALIAAIACRVSPRRVGIAVVGALWNFAALLSVNLLALRQGWWLFPSPAPALHGVPVDGLIGWSVLWGALPVLASRGVPTMPWTATLLALDLLAMSRLPSFVTLGADWLVGEAVALGLGLVPSLVLGRWLLLRRRLVARAALLAIGFAGLLVVVIPLLLLAVLGRPVPDGFIVPWWGAAVVLAGCGSIGLSAVHEFLVAGRGTPLPIDAPKVLVTSGWYRYVRNPMQLSGALVLLAMSALLAEPSIAMTALVAVAFSAGVAAWDEDHDLARRGGARWPAYRAGVRSWLPHWRPCPPPFEATLVVPGRASWRAWLAARLTAARPVGLAILVRPEALRLDYAGADGVVTGRAALGRALEHLGLPWMLVAGALRLTTWPIPTAEGLIATFLDSPARGGPAISGLEVAGYPTQARPPSR